MVLVANVKDLVFLKRYALALYHFLINDKTNNSNKYTHNQLVFSPKRPFP